MSFIYFPQIYGAESYLRSNSEVIFSLILRSKEPATAPYPEQANSSPYSVALFLCVPINPSSSFPAYIVIVLATF